MTTAELILAITSAPFAVIADDERATLARMVNAADAMSATAPAIAADMLRVVSERLGFDAAVHSSCDNYAKTEIVSGLAAACAARA